MVRKDTLDILIIYDNQVYAEELVNLCKNYYKDTNFGFLDDKEEFLKNLRHSWDVVIFGKAYDMSFTDVVGIIQEKGLDLPVICLVDEGSKVGRNKAGLPKKIDSNTIRAIPINEKEQVVVAICLLHNNLSTRRELKKIKAVLLEAEQRANALMHVANSAVAYVDEGIHVYVNKPYIKLFGYSSIEQLMGIPIIDLVASGENVKGFKRFLRNFSKGHREKLELPLSLKRSNGNTFEATIKLAAASYEGEPVTQVIIESEEEIAQLSLDTGDAGNTATLDIVQQLDNGQEGFSGLLGRQAFDENLTQVYQRVLQEGNRAALLLVRVDDTDTAGIQIDGKYKDIILNQVAKRLNEFIEDDEVYQFDEDSFAIIIRDVVHKNDIAKLAQAIHKNVAGELSVSTSEIVSVNVMIGGVFIGQSSPNIDEIIERVIDTTNQVYIQTHNQEFLRQGDIDNNIKFYEPSQHATASDLLLAEYIQEALSSSKFKLFYQPIYDIDTDSSEFYEVTVRLPVAEGKELMADEFLPVADAHNLREKLDRWILINAGRILNKVLKESPNAKILVSLSRFSLANIQLPTMLSKLIQAVGDNQNAINVQFSEQDLIHQIDIAKKQFLAIQKLDCRICIKDFGLTGNGLKLAEQIPPSMVSLAFNIVDNLNDAKATESDVVNANQLVQAANKLQIPVIVPNIKNATTMTEAWKLGARYLQGDYLQPATEEMMVYDANEA